MCSPNPNSLVRALRAAPGRLALRAKPIHLRGTESANLTE